MDKAKRDEAVKRTGSMLLEGWKMLATLCPICNSALLQKADSMRCPACNLPIVQANETNISSFTTTAPAGYNGVSSTINDDSEKHAYASEEKYSHQSLEEAKKEYDKSRSRQNLVSNKIGEKLLLGWTLLSAECPRPTCQGVPLMRNKATPPLEICPACDQVPPSKSSGPASNEFKGPSLPVPSGLDMEDAPFLDEEGQIIDDEGGDSTQGIPA